MLFKRYNKCIYCNSSSLIREKTQYSKHNFYTEAIRNDLEISKKKFKEFVNIETNKQLNQYSNIYFEKIKKDVKINKL